MKEKLTLARNFLYRLFVIAFVLNVLSQIPFMFIKYQGIVQAAQVLGLSPQYLMQLIITYITSIRVILIYFVLCPALALHWTISRDKKFNP